MDRYTDCFTRQPDEQRIEITVTQRLSRNELRCIFIAWAGEQERSYLKVTPTTERLASAVYTLLWLDGSVPTETTTEDPEVLAFAERCTARLWKSKWIVAR